MSLREPFLWRVLNGQARAEDIDDEIAAWHKTDPGAKNTDTPNPYEHHEPLHEWLGLSEFEYAHFVKDAGYFAKVVEKRLQMNDKRRRTVYGTPINPDMGEGRYQDTLRRFRSRIDEGLTLDLDDSDATGDKYTSASWGLCSCKDTKAYPDYNDHTFPDRISDDVAHRYDVLLSPRDPPEGAHCPFDRDSLLDGRSQGKHGLKGSDGCFYRCMLFRPVKGTLPPGESKPRPPTREEALKLYDGQIAKREALFGRKTTKDDGESKWAPSGTVRGKAL